MARNQSEQSAEPVAEVKSRGLDPELSGIIDTETLDNENYYYRLVQERPQRIARMKARGGTFVSATEDGVKTFLGDDAFADDKIRDGDTILMKFPRAKHEERKKAVRQLTRKRLAVPEAQFRKKTKKAGPGGKDINVVTDKE